MKIEIGDVFYSIDNKCCYLVASFGWGIKKSSDMKTGTLVPKEGHKLGDVTLIKVVDRREASQYPIICNIFGKVAGETMFDSLKEINRLLIDGKIILVCKGLGKVINDALISKGVK